MIKPKSAYKRFTEMNLEELRKATADLDREFIADEFGPLPPEAKVIWRRAKRKIGRPKVGKGAKVISVSVEKGLLARSDALARRLGIRRAALIARGLHRVLEEAGQE